jgi:hypothetical protein
MWMCGAVNVPSIRKPAHQYQTDCEFLCGTIFRLITYVGAAQQSLTDRHAGKAIRKKAARPERQRG